MLFPTTFWSFPREFPSLAASRYHTSRRAEQILSGKDVDVSELGSLLHVRALGGVFCCHSIHSTADRDDFFTCPAGLCAIGVHSRLARGNPRGLKLFLNLTSASKVHLIRRLTTKRRMAKVGVVLVDTK